MERKAFIRPQLILSGKRPIARILRHDVEYLNYGSHFGPNTVKHWGKVLAFSFNTKQILVEYVNSANKVSKDLFDEKYVEIQ